MSKYVAAVIGYVCLLGGILIIAKGEPWMVMLGAPLVGFSYGWAWRES